MHEWSDRLITVNLVWYFVVCACFFKTWCKLLSYVSHFHLKRAFSVLRSFLWQVISDFVSHHSFWAVNHPFFLMPSLYSFFRLSFSFIFFSVFIGIFFLVYLDQEKHLFIQIQFLMVTDLLKSPNSGAWTWSLVGWVIEVWCEAAVEVVDVNQRRWDTKMDVSWVWCSFCHFRKRRHWIGSSKWRWSNAWIGGQ